MLKKFCNCFTSTQGNLGKSNIVQNRKDTTNHHSIYQVPYNRAWRRRALIQAQVQDIKRRNVIEPSNSSLATPVVLVKKKHGCWCFCVDYRRLNAITDHDVYPLPRIEDALSRLKRCRYFFIMDSKAGYWQVGVRAEDQEKTVFINDGLY